MAAHGWWEKNGWKETKRTSSQKESWVCLMNHWKIFRNLVSFWCWIVLTLLEFLNVHNVHEYTDSFIWRPPAIPRVTLPGLWHFQWFSLFPRWTQLQWLLERVRGWVMLGVLFKLHPSTLLYNSTVLISYLSVCFKHLQDQQKKAQNPSKGLKAPISSPFPTTNVTLHVDPCQFQQGFERLMMTFVPTNCCQRRPGALVGSGSWTKGAAFGQWQLTTTWGVGENRISHLSS